jgi:hypothetical protein
MAINPERLAQFSRVYRAKLAEGHGLGKYGWHPSKLEEVGNNMMAAVERDSYNKDGYAFRATCKALGIKHTYAAIHVYLHGG